MAKKKYKRKSYMSKTPGGKVAAKAKLKRRMKSLISGVKAVAVGGKKNKTKMTFPGSTIIGRKKKGRTKKKKTGRRVAGRY